MFYILILGSHIVLALIASNVVKLGLSFFYRVRVSQSPSYQQCIPRHSDDDHQPANLMRGLAVAGALEGLDAALNADEPLAF